MKESMHKAASACCFNITDLASALDGWDLVPIVKFNKN